LSNDFYTIKKLNINGLNASETRKINNDLKIFRNINIFLFDNNNISKKIYSNKVIEKFTIFKNYPSTLNIEVKKTKFLAITKKNNNDYLVGANGNLIKINNTVSDLPYIFGNINVNNFLYFKEIIDNSNFKFNDVKNLYYFKSNRWDVITKDGLTLKMPPNLTVEKLNLIYEIIQVNDFHDDKIIDYRQSNMVIINE
jgi:cell division protein FtsQ